MRRKGSSPLYSVGLYNYKSVAEYVDAYGGVEPPKSRGCVRWLNQDSTLMQGENPCLIYSYIWRYGGIGRHDGLKIHW